MKIVRTSFLSMSATKEKKQKNVAIVNGLSIDLLILKGFNHQHIPAGFQESDDEIICATTFDNISSFHASISSTFSKNVASSVWDILYILFTD